MLSLINVGVILSYSITLVFSDEGHGGQHTFLNPDPGVSDTRFLIYIKY